MITKTKFTKMYGAGNDHIYVDTTQYPIADPAKKAVEWSKFHIGVGSDGFVLVGVFDKADFSMHTFNADGLEAMMRGNGSRCINKHVYEYGLTDKTKIMLDIRSGIKILKPYIEGKTVSAVAADMGSPLETEEIQWEGKYPFRSTKVLMGNPHLVTFVEDIIRINLPEIGPELENYLLFPDRTNAEFAQVVSKDIIWTRVWERGSGITQACETGACAIAVAASINGLIGRKSDVTMDRGTVTTKWDETSGHALMTGPAVKVFDGEIEGKY